MAEDKVIRCKAFSPVGTCWRPKKHNEFDDVHVSVSIDGEVLDVWRPVIEGSEQAKPLVTAKAVRDPHATATVTCFDCGAFPSAPHGSDCTEASEQSDITAMEGVSTPGCDCGHQGMAAGWHSSDCTWIRAEATDQQNNTQQEGQDQPCATGATATTPTTTPHGATSVPTTSAGTPWTVTTGSPTASATHPSHPTDAEPHWRTHPDSGVMHLVRPTSPKALCGARVYSSRAWRPSVPGNASCIPCQEIRPDLPHPALSPATSAEARPVRPVYAEPGDVEYEYDEDGQPQDPAVRWPIAWGCTVSIGQYDGALRFTVSISDDVQRDGIAVRSVTRQQIRAYAHHLIKLTELPEVVEDQSGVQPTGDGAP